MFPMLSRRTRFRRPRAATALLIALLVGVHGAGFALTSAETDVDALLESLDPAAQERAADSMQFSQEALQKLFSADVQTAIQESGALTAFDAELDVARVQDILNGELRDVDFLASSPQEISAKFSQLQEQMLVQTEISERVSISSFESSIMDKQTQQIEDKMQELSGLKDKLSTQWLKDLKASDKASSYINNLPPM